MEAQLPQFPFVITEGLSEADSVLAQYWVDQYMKVQTLIGELRRLECVHGRKWADKMIAHNLRRLNEMLESMPPGVHFEIR